MVPPELALSTRKSVFNFFKEKMSIEIRPYIDLDYERLISLYKKSSAYGGKYDPERDTEEKLKLVSEQGNLLVAVEGDAFLGSVMILDNPHTFWLLRFATMPDEIEAAKKLADAATAIAKDRGHNSIIAYTDPKNEELNNRYVDTGFSGSKNYKCYWRTV